VTNSKLNTGSLRKLAASSVVVVAALVILLVMLGIVLNLQGRDPIGVVQAFIRAVSGTERARADVVMNAMPLLLCASGLLLTFTTGLWNIGIEGQITMGAVFATIVARTVTADTPPWLVLPIELLLGMLGGALWALVAGILKTKGNVNEIFGGVALNFDAQKVASGTQVARGEARRTLEKLIAASEE
jgi:simple sugar transport system permease protein